MARAQDQARWERKARARRRHQVAVWLSQEAVERLDDLTRQGKGLRGRGEALERLLRPFGLPTGPNGSRRPAVTP